MHKHRASYGKRGRKEKSQASPRQQAPKGGYQQNELPLGMRRPKKRGANAP